MEEHKIEGISIVCRCGEPINFYIDRETGTIVVENCILCLASEYEDGYEDGQSIFYGKELGDKL